MESEKKKQEYNEYVERITPNNNLWKDMFNAFWIGGLICLMGQVWFEIFTLPKGFYRISIKFSMF